MAQASTNDNTLRFSSSSKKPSPNTQHTPRNTINRNPIKSHKASDKFTWEYGFGYIASWFSARQRSDSPININGTQISESTKDKSLAHGGELFFNENYYIRDRFGLTFGIGVEFIYMKWKDGLAQVNVDTRAGVVEPKINKNEFLYGVYLHSGFFGDVWHKKNQSLRLFATIGVSIDFLVGGQYEKKVDEWECSVFICGPIIYHPNDTKDKTISATLPIQLGARYYFARTYGIDGIEVFVKYHALSWNFTQYHISPNLKTNISRGASVGVRYTYEYK